MGLFKVELPVFARLLPVQTP